MGLFDIVKKLAMGATDEENAANKAKMRAIFNSCVPDGDSYQLIYCHMKNYTNLVVVEINLHSNFIVGYKEGEVAVIPVDPKLEEYGEPLFFNKANGSVLEASWGYCIATNKDASCQFEPITYEPGITKGAAYSVSIIQSSEEVSAFRNFFKKGF